MVFKVESCSQHGNGTRRAQEQPALSRAAAVHVEVFTFPPPPVHAAHSDAA